MKVRIYKDEWCPVWIIDKEPDGYGTEVEIPQELHDRYEASIKEFDEVQRQLHAAREVSRIASSASGDR